MFNTQIKNQRNLLRAFEDRNLTEFKYLLNFYTIDVNKPINNGKSILDIIAETPKSAQYIEVCNTFGADMFKRNDCGYYPLYYAIQSMCADNLRALVRNFTLTKNNDALHYAIVNTQDDAGNNFLHVLISNINKDSFHECYNMIEILLSCRCNPNHLNSYSLTPFELLLLQNEQEGVSIIKLINLFLEKSKFVIELHSRENLITCAIKYDIRDKVLVRNENLVDFKYLLDKIYEGNEVEFASGLSKFMNQNGTHVDFSILIRDCILNNSIKCIEALLESGIKSSVLNNRNNGLPPLFFALSHGRYQIVKLFLKYDDVRFEFENKTWNVLHQICSTKTYANSSDAKQCFDLIIKDKRCTNEIINAVDSKNYSPLIYACESEYDEIVKELLLRGAYIDECTSLHVKEHTLRECLDECISHSGDLNDRNCTVQLNYHFLIPPRSNKKNSIRETKALKSIAKNSRLKKLVTHPLIKSYIDLKWWRINRLIYCGLFVYFLFLLFLSQFILEFFRHEIYRKSETQNKINGTLNNDSSLYKNSVESGMAFDFAPIPPTFIEYDDTGEGETTILPENELKPITKHINSPPIVRMQPIPEAATLQPQTQRTTELFARNLPTAPPRPISLPPLTTAKAPKLSTTTQRPDVNIFKIIFGKRRRRRDVSQNLENDGNFEQKVKEYIELHFKKYIFCLVGILLITIYEIFELVVSGRFYFMKLSNYVDCMLLFLAYAVFLKSFAFNPDTFQRIRAVLFLVIAVQGFLLAAKVSSLSFQLEIFKKVSKTFIKFILLYSFIIFAFAMSFYTIYENNTADVEADDKRAFSNMFISSITIIRMMLSDFENIKLNPDDEFHAVLFLIFMLLITGILFNLMNALAINDTQELMKYAEIMEITKRITIINRCEKMLSMFGVKYFNAFSSSLIPFGSIIIQPNCNNVVRVKDHTMEKGKILTRSISVHKTQIIKYSPIKNYSKLKLSYDTIQKVKDYLMTQQQQESDNKIYCI